MAGGRPTKYKPEFVEQAAALCWQGATNEQLAQYFKVRVSTINKWMIERTEFSDAIKNNKAVYDDRIERSLAERAMGYSHPETKFFCYEGEILSQETTKHYPPDTGAAAFWLKNRRPDEWRDRQEITGAGGGPIRTESLTIDPEALSTEALKEILAARKGVG